MDADDLNARPIFVVGIPRSGTTLLQALIGSHPDIAAPPEVHFFRRILTLEPYYGDLTVDTNLRRAVTDLVEDPLGLLAECEFDVERVYTRVAASDRSYRALLAGLLDDFAERLGKQRWSEKTPGQRASQIWNLMPDAQIVHIIRDPRAVAASRLETPLTRWSPREVGLAWRAHTDDAVGAAARRGSGDYLRLRYEDLVRRPGPVMADVGRFLGVSFDASALDDIDRRRSAVPARAAPWQARALGPLDSDRIDRWQHALGYRARAQIAAASGHLLGALGYPEPSAIERVVGRLRVPRRARRPRGRPISPEERRQRIDEWAERQREAMS